MTTNVTAKQNEVLFTRKQYLNKECTHFQYYSQFVTESTIQSVLRYFNKERLINAYKEDNNLNNIPLSIWNNMPLYAATYKMKDCGDSLSMSGKVCILKCAAKMIIEESINL